MQFQAFNKILLEDQIIKNYVVDGTILGYQFDIRYPSYRGTYLSCIEKLQFKLDDQEIDETQVYFELNGKQYLLKQLRDQYKAYWFVLDEAKITVMQAGGIEFGEHRVTVDMVHRIPYAGYGGTFLTLPSKVTKTLFAE